MKYSTADIIKARELIKVADVYAISSYVPLLDQYPEIKLIADSNQLQYWDYLITISCVGVAFMEIADTVSEKDQQGISYALRDGLTEWQSESYNSLVDYVYSVKRSLDADIELPNAIGNWIWKNIGTHKKSGPQLKELSSSLRLSKYVGMLILKAFHNWWKSRNF